MFLLHLDLYDVRAIDTRLLGYMRQNFQLSLQQDTVTENIKEKKNSHRCVHSTHRLVVM